MDQAAEYALSERGILARCGEEKRSKLGKFNTGIASSRRGEWEVEEA